jgi:protein TonB
MVLELRRFWPPALLSLGLHGLVVAGLGAFSLGTPVAPVPLPILAVEMVEVSEVESAAFSSARATLQKAVNKKDRPKVRAIAVKQVKRVAPARAVVAAAPARIHTTPAIPFPRRAPVPKAAAPTESISDEASMPEPAVQPSAFSPLEAANPAPVGLSVAGVAAPLSRPLPSAEGAARMLRDTVAVGDSGRTSGRTKVLMGNNPRPEYPRLAREAGWEGTVVLLVEVMPDGKAGTVALHKSSGHSVLDDAAVEAVQGWRFKPAMYGNFPIMSVVQLPVRFDLKAAQAN